MTDEVAAGMTDPTQSFAPIRAVPYLPPLEARIVEDIRRVRALCIRGSAVHVYEATRGYRWGKAAHIAERVGTSPSVVGRALWSLKIRLRKGVSIHSPGRTFWQPQNSPFWYLLSMAEEGAFVQITNEPNIMDRAEEA